MQLVDPTARRGPGKALRRSPVQALRAALDSLLRRSFAHTVSVHVLAAASIALLLSVALYFLSPILEDDYHIYRQYLPWIYYLDWSQYDSFVVDHLVVFLSISLPMGWLFLFNITYSGISTRLDVALLVLRVVCCATVCFSLTVILTEFLSRRVMIAIISLAYGTLGLVYSWSVPAWRWYMEEASAKGLVTLLPESVQHLLLRTTLLEWLTDTTFMDKIRPFLPFLLPLSKAEQNRVLEQLPVETQLMLTRPGLATLLPDGVQRVLLPAQSSSDDEGGSVEDLVARQITLPTKDGEDGDAGSTSAPQSTASALQCAPNASAGFDFHQVTSADQSTAREGPEDVVGEIMTTRLMRGCMELAKMPSTRVIDRTIGVSTALFVLQLYASQRSRRMVASLLQFVVASSLVSIASLALTLRVIQAVTVSGQAAPLLRYIRQYLVRSLTSATAAPPQLIAAKPAALALPATETLKKTATSVSAIVAVMYVLRRLRR
ncbi:hypothetical protein P43SY_006347 [Pythium insidiosum]|uniref:Uncharacterized protein n=1 Tax=Pythium insidiosum TaxID=114742 RepID=A0AAD5Q536_PYTIN|nr:hypothetical protein P43SY_006347 [Pythium insidiosum]